LDDERSTASTYYPGLSHDQGANEAKVIAFMGSLLVPSAEFMTLRHNPDVRVIDSYGEDWNRSMPITGTAPRPDFAVGFSRGAFTPAQLDKLASWLGGFAGGPWSFFRATEDMCFPFLTCQVRCGDGGLDTADRMNAHSMTIAVRAVVKLYELVHRVEEVHRRLLGFSVSHNDTTIRIYGHYCLTTGARYKYQRHTIKAFSFTANDGRERGMAGRFFGNVYRQWIGSHLQFICRAINTIAS
jgi:hypothetical protein